MEDLPIYLGRVTYIIDLDYFYMHIGTADQLEEFSQLEENIAKCTLSCTCIYSINDISEGQMVLADCQETYGCWRRGQITRIDPQGNSADVYYIDYGETENIGEERICSDLKPEFLSFPSQALRCCIAGIRPIAKNWTTRAAKIFEQHTQIKIFNTVILQTDNGIFKVALYNRDGKQRCLSAVLVDEDLGFPVDDEVTEFFEDAEEFYSTYLAQKSSDEFVDYTQCYLDSEEFKDTSNNCINVGTYPEVIDDITQGAQITCTDNSQLTLQFSDHQCINNDTSDTSLSPEIIPQFNFDSLHQTQKTTSDKLLEKNYKQTQEAMQIEIERVKIETVEQSKLAVAAGYGGIEDDTSHLDQKSPTEDWDRGIQEEVKTSWKEVSPPPREKRTTPHGKELLNTLNQIFIDSEREPVDEIRVRVRSLFGTDACLFLNREEMSDLLNTVINRAVRYYGVIHDIILEILEILSGTQYFHECLYDAVKKVQDMHIKIQYKGKSFHVQCSKILGHLFNMSFHWSNSSSLQEYVASLLEKWIMFNKKGQQIGTDRLQEMYLECFETIWEISGDALLGTFHYIKPRLLKECEDKILSTDVSHNIRSQTLQIYILLKMKQGSTTEQGSQTEVCTTDVSCQTEAVEKAEDVSEYKTPRYQKSNVPPFYPPKSSKVYDKSNSGSSTPNSFQDNSDKLNSEDSWPSLTNCRSNILGSGKTSSPLNVGKESVFYTIDKESDNARDPLLLLTPASFSNSNQLNDSDSSPNSSLYYSLNENVNNSALVNNSDESLIVERTVGPSLREVSPLYGMIEADTQTNFYKTVENKNIKSDTDCDESFHDYLSVASNETSQKKGSFGEQNKVPDWWDEEKQEIKQVKVKEDWDNSDSDDTSEDVVVKSEELSKTQPKSLDDVASWMSTSAKTQPLSISPVPQIHSRNTVKSYEPVCESKEKNLLRKQYNEVTDNISSSTKYHDENKNETVGESIKQVDHEKCTIPFTGNYNEKTQKSSNRKDVDAEKNTDSDDSDEEWETYSTDDNSQANNSESLSNELPKDDNLVTIVRECTPTEKPKPSWKPMGSRKCTVCGDSTHLVYDCPDKNKRGLFY